MYLPVGYAGFYILGDLRILMCQKMFGSTAVAVYAAYKISASTTTCSVSFE